MDRKLILVGTVHTDIHGEPRLERAINKINPSHLTFELDGNSENSNTGFNLEDMTQVGVELNKEIFSLVYDLLSLDKIVNEDEMVKEYYQNLITYGFEKRVASRYKKAGHPQVYLIDKYITTKNDTNEIVRLSNSYKEDIHKPKVVQKYYEILTYLYPIFADESESDISVHYFAYSFFTKDEIDTIINYNYTEKGTQSIYEIRNEVIKRDEAMESEIRNLWASSTGDLMHTGGILHIFGDYYNNLYKRLRDLNPVRYRLNTFNNV